MKYLVGFLLMGVGCAVPGWLMHKATPDQRTPILIAGITIGVCVATMGLLICACRPDRDGD